MGCVKCVQSVLSEKTIVLKEIVKLKTMSRHSVITVLRRYIPITRIGPVPPFNNT